VTVKTLEDHYISHSSLSMLIQSPFKYKMHILSPQEEDTSYFRKGAAFDTLLTEPDEFLNRYAVSRTPPPSGMMGEFVRIYLDECSKNTKEADARVIAYKDSGFKLKYEAVIKKFEASEIQDYLKFVEETQGKTVLSLEEFQQANNMAMHVKGNLYAGKYLLATNPDITIDYQKKIKFNHKGYEVVSILDLVRIDHANKKIIPIDIKSTSKSVTSFESSYLKYGYYRQGALYTLACLSEYKDLIDKGYTIDPFRFIVCETSCYNPPIVFQMSDIDIAVGMDGGTSSMGYEYLGINQLIERLQWHQENNLWDYPRDVYDSGGTKVLQTFN
jgi:hypothetical protein